MSAGPSKSTKNPDTEVGYGKPPRHTQFKPGQSGNPKGRPKGTKNLKTDLMEELSEKIVIHEGERTQRVSKQRAIVKSLVNRTLKGDARASNLLFPMVQRLDESGETDNAGSEPLNGEESEILNEYKERVKREIRAAASSTKPDPEFGRRS
jgi:hypothetical protein